MAATACACLLTGMGLGLQGQTCITQAELTAAERGALVDASQKLSQSVAADDTKVLQADIAPQEAGDTGSILNAVSDVAAKLKGATFTVDELYLLDATDLKPHATNARFYCGAFNLPTSASITLGSLPLARYGLVLMHATGIANPQQIAVIFLEAKAQWKLAGFSSRQLTMAGHDSLWYWKQARVYAGKGEKWNAYFYYATARYLATPVDYLSSTNLEKLMQEQQSAQPSGLPGQLPMHLIANGQTFEIAQMETSDALGGLDLVMHYNAKDTNNLTAARRQNIAVMQAMLQAHPELKNAFHGLWVYAVAPGQAPFGIELPMKQIP
ncbi:MAG TPA: hypothetical protein VHX63_15655 [Acidobacteriaceae bacterium]|nr:hypothetical protein [Acidobacteriaceae bacterium]